MIGFGFRNARKFQSARFFGTNDDKYLAEASKFVLLHNKFPKTKDLEGLDTIEYRYDYSSETDLQKMNSEFGLSKTFMKHNLVKESHTYMSLFSSHSSKSITYHHSFDGIVIADDSEFILHLKNKDKKAQNGQSILFDLNDMKQFNHDYAHDMGPLEIILVPMVIGFVAGGLFEKSK